MVSQMGTQIEKTKNCPERLNNKQSCPSKQNKFFVYFVAQMFFFVVVHIFLKRISGWQKQTGYNAAVGALKRDAL